MTFNCSICEKGYNSSYGLRRHVSENHKCTRFKCSCGKDFSRKLTLSNHKINCMGGNVDILNSGESSNVTQSSDNNLAFVNTKNDDYNNSSDSSNCREDDEGEDKPPEKRLRISHKSQNGSGDDSDRLDYNRKGDIFSKNNTMRTDSEEINSDESDDYSEENSSDESDDHSDGNSSDESDSDKICNCWNCNSSKKSKIKHVHSKKRKFYDRSEGDSEESDKSDKICYCRNCNFSKKCKIKYVPSKKRKFYDRSEGGDSEKSNSDGETQIDEDSNLYSKYYKSQVSGGGVFKTIIGNHTGNIGRQFSYLPNTRFPIGNGLMKPVSSYLY